MCQKVIEHLFKHKPGQKATVAMFASNDKDVFWQLPHVLWKSEKFLFGMYFVTIYE